MPKIPKPPAYETPVRKMMKKKMPSSGGRDTRPTEMIPPRKNKIGPKPTRPKAGPVIPMTRKKSGIYGKYKNYGPVPMPRKSARPKAGPRRKP